MEVIDTQRDRAAALWLVVAQLGALGRLKGSEWISVGRNASGREGCTFGPRNAIEATDG